MTSSPDSPITLEHVRRDEQVRAYIHQANENLRALGYTEHGPRHAGLVAKLGRDILLQLDYPEREAELVAIAGYLHDVGNVVHRENHALSGAQIAQGILSRLGMGWSEIACVINAIGNHEEERGVLTNGISAALVIADKADVHHTRVQEKSPLRFDIHDRVNYAVRQSSVDVDRERSTIALNLEIDTGTSSVMEYFEIFLSRMLMCRRAAQRLDCEFALVINDLDLL